MGVCFDCFWWWRAEFGVGQAYPEEGDSSTADLNMSPSFDDYFLLNSTTDASVFPDWEWAAGTTFPFEPDLTYNGEQSMPEDFTLPLST